MQPYDCAVTVDVAGKCEVVCKSQAVPNESSVREYQGDVSIKVTTRS
jgi:hypothetical protein